MELKYILLVLTVIACIILSIVVIKLMRKHLNNKLLRGVNDLQIRKNNLDSLPVLVELSKIDDIAKSEQLEEKVTDFKSRYQELKEIRLTKVNDMIVDLDVSVEKRNIQDYVYKYSNIEIELDEIETSLQKILSEIDEIASYEEKYRNIITKLKAKYRFLDHSYQEKETLFGDIKDVIKMQLENIEKRFTDFDKVMEEKLYNEVVLVVKSIDTMIDNLDIVIREVPDIVLLLNDLIPGRIKDLKEEYHQMISEGYPLGYLEFEKNMDEISKKENDILTRAKVLNINDSLFDLRTILEYLDGLFKDLEKEKNAKSDFLQIDEAFDNKVKKLEKLVKDIYGELDDIKSLYDLQEKDLEIIDQLNLKLASIIKDHKKLLRDIKKGTESYLKHNMTLNELTIRLDNVSNDFDNSLRTLGSFYDDEIRAREQLKDMKNLIKKCKMRIREYHLPIIYDNYFVEEDEANEAIVEIDKELQNKPIVIKTLNMRVDTARDLAFKLNQTTDNMIKYAYFTELLIQYANKYRDNEDVNRGLSKSEMLFYRGNYKDSFDLSLKIIKLVDNELYLRIKKICKE